MMFEKIKNKVLGIATICLVSSGCTSMFDVAGSDNFETSPFKYWQAKVTKEVSVPGYIANNIDREPLYPIPMDKKLGGTVKVNKAPPTLGNKIQDMDS